jgi:NTP pyrophosphatase (non-canonical NTP hydrolase)
MENQMMPEQKDLVEFHELFQMTTNQYPCFSLSTKDKELHVNLIHEENTELKEAANIYDVADALGDLLYVVLSAAVTYGINLKPVFDEIHRSNMTKLWTGDELLTVSDDFRSKHNSLCVDDNAGIHGKRAFIVRRISDGKVIKSPSYSPAAIKSVIDAQLK